MFFVVLHIFFFWKYAKCTSAVLELYLMLTEIINVIFLHIYYCSNANDKAVSKALLTSCLILLI